MDGLSTRPLTDTTWPDFARLVEAHSGVWGGCWCMAFHAKGEGWGKSAEANRAEKEALVRAERAHAALVYRGENCVGWCQYGSPAELPRIKARKAYEAGAPGPADWRITCFFTAKGQRGQGIAEAALQGALRQIAVAGGGMVEAFPEATEGRKVSGSFLFSGPLDMFERHGFRRDRPLGKDRWLVSRAIEPVI